MENVLEKTREAAEGYLAQVEKDALRATRSVWAAVRAMRKDLRALEQTDKGITQRVARELGEALGKIEPLKPILDDEETINKIHNRQMADEHMKRIETHLGKIIEQMESSRSDKIKDWLKAHPVLGPLMEALSEKLPESGYILLFQGAGEKLRLVTSKTQDGRIFTRYRQREFKDKKKLYRLYKNRIKLTGAAIVVDRKLVSSIGSVPKPEEGKDEVDHLVRLSNEEASKPARRFVETNPVLKRLNELAREKQVDKDAYILLFVAGSPESESENEASVDAEAEQIESPAPGDGVEDSSDAPVADEAQAELETPEAEENLETEIEAQSAEESSSDEPEAQESETPGESFTDPQETTQDIPPLPGAEAQAEAGATAPEAVSSPEEASTGPEIESEIETESESESEPESEPEPESESEPEPEAESEAQAHDERPEQISLLLRPSTEGKVFTRFYASEFADTRKIFETFKSTGSGKRGSTICGAAVIKGNNLLHSVGHLPEAKQGEGQLRALVRESNFAADQPSRDFIEANEVLNGLNKMASDNSQDASAAVVLFAEEDGGRLSPLTPKAQKGGRGKTIFALGDFRMARDIFNVLKDSGAVVGASVIAEFKPPSKDSRPGQKDGDSDRRRGPRRPDGGPAQARKHVVKAALGRTPLQTNILITEDTIRRLGFDFLNDLKREPRFERSGPGGPGRDRDRGRRRDGGRGRERNSSDSRDRGRGRRSKDDNSRSNEETASSEA